MIPRVLGESTLKMENLIAKRLDEESSRLLRTEIYHPKCEFVGILRRES